jgi:hypothetical protein
MLVETYKYKSIKKKWDMKSNFFLFSNKTYSEMFVFFFWLNNMEY